MSSRGLFWLLRQAAAPRMDFCFDRANCVVLRFWIALSGAPLLYAQQQGESASWTGRPDECAVSIGTRALSDR